MSWLDYLNQGLTVLNAGGVAVLTALHNQNKATMTTQAAAHSDQIASVATQVIQLAQQLTPMAAQAQQAAVAVQAAPTPVDKVATAVTALAPAAALIPGAEPWLALIEALTQTTQALHNHTAVLQAVNQPVTVQTAAPTV